jgi:Glycine/D-amino acid oxidases (deaminating)
MLTAEPKAYGSNWHAATRVEGPARTRLTVELDVDLCVIGAGLAGLTVAREVARHGWSVVVLEAKSVAWSASGRNTGVVLPGFSVSADALIERVGLAEPRHCGRVLWRAPNMSATPPAICRARRSPKPVGCTCRKPTTSARWRMKPRSWPASSAPRSSHGRPTGCARRCIRPATFMACIIPRGFSLHPLNYALGLAAAAEAAGVRIFEDTPVLEIDPAGVRKRVVTSHSRVRAAMWCWPATCI